MLFSQNLCERIRFSKRSIVVVAIVIVQRLEKVKQINLSGRPQRRHVLGLLLRAIPMLVRVRRLQRPILLAPMLLYEQDGSRRILQGGDEDQTLDRRGTIARDRSPYRVSHPRSPRIVRSLNRRLEAHFSHPEWIGLDWVGHLRRLGKNEVKKRE